MFQNAFVTFRNQLSKKYINILLLKTMNLKMGQESISKNHIFSILSDTEFLHLNKKHVLHI